VKPKFLIEYGNAALKLLRNEKLTPRDFFIS